MTVPKAELHVHVEGAAGPGLIRRIAARNGGRVPDGVFDASGGFRWRDFLDFLDTYDRATSVIRTGEDYRDIVYEYLVGCAAEGAIYVELIVSPDHAASVGLTDEQHYGGIAAGSGLGCSIHAGEHAGPESVRAALELPITRMSHGVRAIEDPALVAELAERGIDLEVCPSSNVSLGLYPSYENHPLGALREAGVRVTLGSDDPPYFGCSIGSEYAVAQQRQGFDEEQLRDVTRIAVEASFAEDAVKEDLHARLDFLGNRGSH